jgi:L-ascorbate metabolism protein UlaG (beta-lactamase superfamily)
VITLQWLGAAGFLVATEAGRFLIDPYLSRLEGASPPQPLRPADLRGVGPIFLTHGHFDHASDVAALLGDDQMVYGSPTALAAALRDGAPAEQIRPARDGQVFELDGLRAQAFASRHVRFDLPLIAASVRRAGWWTATAFNLALRYPAGQVMSWRFSVGDTVIHHFGSAGSTSRELARLAEWPADVLMIPLAGHSKIVEIALRYVATLRPRIVIAHHFDDFMPGILETADVQTFVDAARRRFPTVQVIAPALNQPIYL